MAAVATVDFERFHTEDLPTRLAAGNGALAHDDVAGIGAIGFRLAETGQAYTYVPDDGAIRIVEGDEPARTVVVLDQASWDGLAQDYDTAPGLLYGGKATAERGSILRFVEWEPALRAMFHGRPIYVPDADDLRDRSGAPLDVTHHFTLDELRADPDAGRHFLDEAGCLVVDDVFTPDEVAAMLAGADRLRAEAVEGDRKSWWAKDATGDAVLCRVTSANRLDVFRSLYDDERMLLLAALSEHGLVPRARDAEEGATVLWKLPGITEGLADLPWHRDCGMGGHASMCPLLIATICLTEGGPEAGELRALPGSHRGSFHFIDGNDPAAPTGVGLDVRAGGVTLHYSDTGHVSMPPTSDDGPFRISALVAFVPPTAHHHRGEGAYNDVLLDRDDGQVEHLRDKVAGR